MVACSPVTVFAGCMVVLCLDSPVAGVGGLDTAVLFELHFVWFLV